jgi:hypothetical protein
MFRTPAVFLFFKAETDEPSLGERNETSIPELFCLCNRHFPDRGQPGARQ